MTKIEDIALAEGLNVNFIGLIFAPKSPRKLTISQAKLLRPHIVKAKAVGVFEGNSPEEIAQCIEELKLDLVQIYGDIPDGISIPVIHAFRGIPALKNIGASEYVLIDKADGQSVADPGTLQELPEEIRARLFLAGGLTPENVRAMSDRIHPFAVDCARGIESAPGIKDHQRIRSFLHAL